MKSIALLDIDLRVEKIAMGLVSEACVPPNVFEDALHIAIAGVHQMDFILTWNFKHIANPMLQEKIARYLDHCGVTMPYICSPQELLGDDDGSIDG